MPKRKTKTAKALEKAKAKPKKKPPPKAKRTNYVTAAEAEKMFLLYQEIKDTGHGGGYSGVAKQFGRDIKTVRRIAAKDDWGQRLAKIEADIRKGHDRKIIRQELTNLDMGIALKNKVFSELLGRGKDLNPTVLDGVRVLQYVDEASGGLPTEAELAAEGFLTPEQVDRALETLNNLGEKALAGLADHIVTLMKDADQ